MTADLAALEAALVEAEALIAAGPRMPWALHHEIGIRDADGNTVSVTPMNRPNDIVGGLIVAAVEHLARSVKESRQMLLIAEALDVTGRGGAATAIRKSEARRWEVTA